MGRLKRVDAGGYAYHVLNRGAGRRLARLPVQHGLPARRRERETRGRGARVDSLAEVGHNVNMDAGWVGDQVVEAKFYALQDQQFNLLALVTAKGEVAERYEYTLYGQRMVFRPSDVDLATLLPADLDYNGDVDDVQPERSSELRVGDLDAGSLPSPDAQRRERDHGHRRGAGGHGVERALRHAVIDRRITQGTAAKGL